MPLRPVSFSGRSAANHGPDSATVAVCDGTKHCEEILASFIARTNSSAGETSIQAEASVGNPSSRRLSRSVTPCAARTLRTPPFGGPHPAAMGCLHTLRATLRERWAPPQTVRFSIRTCPCKGSPVSTGGGWGHWLAGEVAVHQAGPERPAGQHLVQLRPAAHCHRGRRRAARHHPGPAALVRRHQPVRGALVPCAVTTRAQRSVQENRDHLVVCALR